VHTVDQLEPTPDPIQLLFMPLVLSDN